MAATINEDLCTGCGDCIIVCPARAITIEDGKAKVNDECMECGICVSECPVEAIDL